MPSKKYHTREICYFLNFYPKYHNPSGYLYDLNFCPFNILSHFTLPDNLIKKFLLSSVRKNNLKHIYEKQANQFVIVKNVALVGH